MSERAQSSAGSMSASPRSQLTCFLRMLGDSLRLETVNAHTFESRHVWCPSGRNIMYGGQLIAHTVEAAHRTVDTAALRMNSLRVTFASPGLDDGGSPVRYTVDMVRDGRTFTLRSIRVTQKKRLLLVAMASFCKLQPHESAHEMALPRFARGRGASVTEKKMAFQQRLDYLKAQSTRLTASEEASTAPSSGASLAVLNVLTPPDRGSAYSKDVWMRVLDDGVQNLAVKAGIPSSRIHLIVACWLSDVTVALASLFPYGYPDVAVRMMASLDHCVYVHNVEAMNVSEWFAFEVRSSWSNSGVALNHGRLYGTDGTLWMSIAQQTVARLGPATVSQL